MIKDMKKIIIISNIFLLLFVLNSTTYFEAFGDATFVQSIPTNGNIGTAEGLIFRPDGLKMYITDDTGDLIEEFNLSSAWQISTISHASSNKDVSGQDSSPEDIAFNADGTKMFLTARNGDKIKEYTVSPGYDVSEASYQSGQDGDVSGQTNNPEDVYFSTDGLKMFVLENEGTDTVLEYTLGSAFDVSDESFEDAFTLAVQNNGADSMEFSADGKKLFVTDNSHVTEHNLSTAWDISTTSYLNKFDITSHTTNPKGLAFSPDGLNMYIIESSATNQLHHYTLDVAWSLFAKDLNAERKSDISQFPPHIHDEIEVSINSEESSIIKISEKQVTTIKANVGDTVNIMVSLGDDLGTGNISVVKMITNYDKTPSGMNNYFKTNKNDANEVGLSVYEWYSNKDDVVFNYLQTTSWNEPTLVVQKRINPYHEYVGSLPFDEKELLIKYSITMNQEISSTQVGLKVSDYSGGQINMMLPILLEIIPEKISPDNNSAVEEPVVEEPVVEEPVVEEPVVEEPVVEEPVVEIELNDVIMSNVQTLLQIPASFVDESKDPQHYIDRYNNEPTYKEWFDENYSQYSSIYEAVGLEELVVAPISEPVVEVTSIPKCGSGTEDVNGICQVIQNEEKSKGGGCLIATATYGSEMAIEVQQLRELRDNQLLQTESGTAFIATFNDIYYSFSPTIADMEREHPLFKEAVKIAITPMISTLSLMENAESESEVLSIGISVIMLNLGMYLAVPAIVIVGIKKRF